MDVKVTLLEALNAIKRAKTIEPMTIIETSALRWELYASLQNILDAISMIIADLNLRKPSSYSDLGRILREANLISEETEGAIRTIAVTRNIIAHAYRRISVEELQEIKTEMLPKIENTAKELLEMVERENLDPEVMPKTFKALSQPFRRHGVLLAYLFGSRARGTADEESDYDIAVLFSSDKASIIDEANLALELSSALNKPADKIDVVSLNRADLTVKARVLREGIPIYYSDEEFKRRWERKTLLEVLDGTDLYAIYVKRSLKRIIPQA